MKRKASGFPARLDQARRMKGLTLDELAERSSFSRSGINKWLASDTAPRSNNLKRVAAVLDVSIAWLLGESDAGGPLRVAEAAQEVERAVRALSDELPGTAPGQEPRSPKGPPLLTPLARPDLMDEAFREALAAVGIPAAQFGNAKKLMMLTLLLYDRRAEKEADELAAILTGAPSSKPKATAS